MLTSHVGKTWVEFRGNGHPAGFPAGVRPTERARDRLDFSGADAVSELEQVSAQVIESAVLEGKGEGRDGRGGRGQ